MFSCLFQAPHRTKQNSGRLDEAVPLVEEFEHALPAFQVCRIGCEREPLAGTCQRHVQHLADVRRWTFANLPLLLDPRERKLFCIDPN